LQQSPLAGGALAADTRLQQQPGTRHTQSSLSSGLPSKSSPDTAAARRVCAVYTIGPGAA
jgi:hypothetical protein